MTEGGSQQKEKDFRNHIGGFMSMFSTCLSDSRMQRQAAPLLFTSYVKCPFRTHFFSSICSLSPLSEYTCQGVGQCTVRAPHPLGIFWTEGPAWVPFPSRELRIRATGEGPVRPGFGILGLPITGYMTSNKMFISLHISF